MDALELAPAPEVRLTEPARALTITVGGDLGLNAHGAEVVSDGARRHGRFLTWPELTAGIRPLLTGDLNFANLETVVTARNDLSPTSKAFTFRSHPAGVRHLAAAGFNVLSTANNHAVDYGVAGMRETMAYLDRMVASGDLKAHIGLAANREAAALPRTLQSNGISIAISALGIDSGGRAGSDRPGLMSWRAREDVAEVIDGLSAAVADYRILSVHQGRERDVTVQQDTIRKLRHQAVLGGKVDLVVGHHAHVAQGIELTDGRLIFYGLGNLLHPGMQDMSVFGMCQDYGLFARIHLVGDREGPLRVAAVEVIPLAGMHWQATPMPAEEAIRRILVLNHLSSALDDPQSGAKGLRLSPLADGRGLYCAPDAASMTGRVGELCRAPIPAVSSGSAVKRQVAAACASGAPAIAARRRPGLTRASSVPTQSAGIRPRAQRDWRARIFADH